MGLITVDGEDYFVKKANGTPVCIRIATNDWKIFKRRKKESDTQLQKRVVETVQRLRSVRAKSFKLEPVALVYSRMLSDRARLTTIERTVHANVSWQGDPMSTPESQVQHLAKRQDMKESPASAAASMLPPPFVPIRPSTRAAAAGAAAACAVDTSASHATAQLAACEVDALASHATAQPPEFEGAPASLKSLQKKVREIQRLQGQAAERSLSHEEATKIAKLPVIQTQIELIICSTTTPIASAVATPNSERSAAATLSDAHATLHALQALPAAKVTRHTSAETLQQLEAARVEREHARRAAQEAAAVAEVDLWALLRAPLDSWDDEAIWQLAICEFAMLHLDYVMSTPKQLQLELRDACVLARHPEEVPRLRGSMRIDALQDALGRSDLLRAELKQQLARYKRLYLALFSGFGRFRRLKLLPGESLLGLMARTHSDALKWRPPGRTPAEKLALEFKAKGRIVAEWRHDAWLQRHMDTGGTLSLRGTAGATRAGLRRLKKLPEGEKPKGEHYTTIRLHDYQAHHIQRAKSLTNSFAVKRCMIQWDEATINALSWCVIILNCVRVANLREREVLSTSKLAKDAQGMAKTGVGVSGAGKTALEDFDMPVANIDFCCTDTTASNSSLKLPREKGGYGGKGGAYAHMWAWFRLMGHILFFMIWCLSHLASNEVKEVMQSYGACPKGQVRLRKSAKRGARAGPSKRAAGARATGENAGRVTAEELDDAEEMEDGEQPDEFDVGIRVNPNL